MTRIPLSSLPSSLLSLSSLRKFSGTNLRHGGRDEFLVAAPRTRELDENSTRRAINELVSRHRHVRHVAGFSLLRMTKKTRMRDISRRDAP